MDLLKKFFVEKADIYSVQFAFLYGSQAHGLPREDSDVDIAVVLKDESLSEERTFSILSAISLSLSKAAGRNVDVMLIYRDFRKPTLYYNAIIQGTPIYVCDYEAFSTLRNEAISQMEDFNIFGTQWQLSVAKEKLREISRA